MTYYDPNDFSLYIDGVEVKGLEPGEESIHFSKKGGGRVKVTEIKHYSPELIAKEAERLRRITTYIEAVARTGEHSTETVDELKIILEGLKMSSENLIEYIKRIEVNEK